MRHEVVSRVIFVPHHGVSRFLAAVLYSAQQKTHPGLRSMRVGFCMYCVVRRHSRIPGTACQAVRPGLRRVTVYEPPLTSRGALMPTVRKVPPPNTPMEPQTMTQSSFIAEPT